MAQGACSESGCSTPARVRGLCKKHYRARRATGDLPPISYEHNNPYTEAENWFILDNPELTAAEIGKAIGRTEKAVNGQRKKLRARHPNEPEVSKGGNKRNRNPQFAGHRTVVAKTCTDCGLLLDGSMFYATQGRAYPYCRKCNRARSLRHSEQGASLRHFHDMQAITTPLAERNGEPYTESDVQILSDTAMSVLEMALRTKRTYAGAMGARKRLGLPPIHNDIGDIADHRWLIELHPDVAQRLGLLEPQSHLSDRSHSA